MNAALQQQQTAPAPTSQATYVETVAPSITPKKDEQGESRFQRLRDTLFHKSAPNQKKGNVAADQPLKHIGGEIVECPGMKVGFNPSDPSSMNCCATHFKNAARKMNEFHDTPKPRKDSRDIIGNIKDAIMGPKETAVVQHEFNADGSKFRISNEDKLLWRRLHLGAKELDYVIAASMRADRFHKRRSAHLHAQNKRWKMRVDAQNKKAREALRSLNAIMNTKHDAATKRHKAFLDDRVRELAAHDKVRARKGKKALADRKRADKHAEAKA